MSQPEGEVLIDHDNLDEFSDPLNYDAQDSSDTGVAFYAALARETGGPVLEIACGTGRVGVPIARQGFAVTGVDLVPGMLEQARRKSAGLDARWIQGDARSFELGERFRLAFLTGNAFQLFLTRADQAAVLRRARAHLGDGGMLAFETRNPRWVSPLDRSPGEEGAFFTLVTRGEERGGPGYTDRAGREVRVFTTQVYDHPAQVLHLTSSHRWEEGGQPRSRVSRIALRYTFPQELAALLDDNGFMLERQYGDWTLEPLTAASPSIIVVCRKRQ